MHIHINLTKQLHRVSVSTFHNYISLKNQCSLIHFNKSWTINDVGSKILAEMKTMITRILRVSFTSAYKTALTTQSLIFLHEQRTVQVDDACSDLSNRK